MRVNNTIAIDRSPRDVFSYVSDLSFLAEVDPDVSSVKKLFEGPPRVGAVFREELQLPGMSVTADLRITHLEEGALEFDFSSAQMEGTGRLECDPDEAGTLLTLRVEASMRGAWNLIWPIVRIEFPWRERMRIRNIKKALEGGSALSKPEQRGPADIADTP